MNKIERLVYNMVKGNPAIKFVLRNAYQGIFDLLPTPAQQSVAPIESREDCFFGFHDRSPFSADETKVLCGHTTIPLRMPHAGEALELGYITLDEQGRMGEFHTIAQSKAWNYHKGCRLQWLNQQSAIFNNRNGKQLVAEVVDTNARLLDTIPYPIDTASPDGTKATSFSYERLNELMPGYGYEDCTDGGLLDQQAPDDTGFYLIDLETHQRSMLLSLRQLADSVANDESSHEARHYVTHSEFSPDGHYVSFLHRWIGSDYRKRHSRLIVYDLHDNRWWALPTTGMVSHYIWNRRNQIVAYCSVAEGDGHVCFEADGSKYHPILFGTLNDDGHQSMVSGDVFVTDTYPDKRRMARLWMVDMASQCRIQLARVYSPKKFQTIDFHCHIACDLHPRVSPSGKFVCFDAAFSGKRSLCVMPLPQKDVQEA